MSAKLIINNNVVEGIDINNVGDGVIEIPENVVSIKDYAFEGCPEVKKVDMSNAVKLTYIGKFAFYNCKNLESVNMGHKIEAIGRSAFQNCTSLKAIEMFYGLSRIEGWTFAGCSSLTSVSIPNSVKEICTQAFACCYCLNKIVSYSNGIQLTHNAFLHVDFGSCTVEVPLFCMDKYDKDEVWNRFNTEEQKVFSYEGILYEKNPNPDTENTLWVAPDNNVNGEASILATVPVGDEHYAVVGIDANAFYGNKYLESVTIPASITHIGDNAFSMCDNLKEFKVTNISSRHFDVVDEALFDKKLTTLIAFPPANDRRKAFDIPASVDTLAAGAFSKAKNLQYIRFNKSYENKMLSAAFEKNELDKKNCTLYVPVNQLGKSMQSYLKDRLGFQHVELSNKSDRTFIYKGFEYRVLGAENYSECTGEAALGKMLPENTDTKITIPEWVVGEPFKYKVVKIGYDAFKNRSAVVSVSIPETVTEIEGSAFAGTGISSINIPETVTGIGPSTFQDCIALKSVNIPQKVNRIESYIFSGCKSLSSIVLPDKVSEIGYAAFSGCKSLSSIVLPDKVSEIGIEAFSGCSALTSVSLPKISKIANDVFKDCTNMSSIVIPASVSLIERSAFSGCTSLHSISIPNSVETIKDNAFCGCTGLSSVNIPDSVKTLGGDAFKNCSALKTVSLSKSMDVINGGTFEGCSSLSSVSIPDSVGSIYANAFKNCTSLKTVKIPDTTDIGDAVFTGCKALSSVTIPRKAEKIGFEAFMDCSSLTSVSIPDSVKKIETNAFAKCTSLTKIVIPDSVSSIGDTAFYECSSLGSITIPNSVTVLSSKLFGNCKALTEVVIPDSVTVINGFYGCSALSKIIIPKSATTIKTNAFYGCSKLKIIDCRALTKMPVIETANAFSGITDCYVLVSSLKNFNSDANRQSWLTVFKEKFIVERLPSFQVGNLNYSFISQTSNYVEVALNPNARGAVTIPETITYENKTYPVIQISDDAFKNNANITSVNFAGENITAIGANAFNACTALSSITIPSSVTKIGNNAFQGCTALASVAFASPVNLHTIGSYSFDNCSRLGSIDIPSNVKSVGEYAFRGCSNLKKFSYKVGTSIGNHALLNCPLLKMDTICSSFKVNGLFYQITSEEPSKTVKITGCTSGTTAVQTAGSILHPFNDVAYNITEIAEKAFSTQNHPECKTITSVQIGGNAMKKIGNWAFKGCSALTSLTLPNSVESIGEEAFRGTSINSISKWTALKSLSRQAFMDCKALKTVVLGENLDIINTQTFSGCDKLTSISFESTSAVTIKDAAFSGCNNLNKVKFSSTKPPIVAPGAFANIAASGTYSVPKGSESKYINDSGWKRYFKDWKSE